MKKSYQTWTTNRAQISKIIHDDGIFHSNRGVEDDDCEIPYIDIGEDDPNEKEDEVAKKDTRGFDKRPIRNRDSQAWSTLE